MLTEPFAPITLGDNSLWALRLHASEGGGWALIDAGPDFTEGGGTSWEMLVEQLQEQGADPSEVRVVVVTHEHIDHAGLAARWASMGARVIGGRKALPTVAGGAEAFERIRAARGAELLRQGASPELVEHWRTLMRPRALRWPGCPQEALLAAEDVASLRLIDGREVRLVGAPGHTPGHVLGLIEGAREAFTGDTLISTTIPTPGLQFPQAVTGDASMAHLAPRWPSLPAFLRTVAWLRAWGPARVYAGHGGVMTEPGVHLDRFEAHHRRLAAQVRAALDEGAVTAFEIARAMYRRLPDVRLAQAMIEVVGHLDVMEGAGIVERSVEWRSDGVRWRLRAASAGAQA